MSKHTPGSYGFLIEDNNLYIEWNEQENTVKLSNQKLGEQLVLNYDEAGTIWRMLSYLLVPTGATGKYT